MNQNIDDIMSFELSGKFAHFRKYYTNTSALSYLIPPKTVIMGIISSILKIPRNEYYDLFSSDNQDLILISVKISEECEVLKMTHSLNNLSLDYWKLVNFKKGGDLFHSPTKTEILFERNYSNIIYKVFIGYKQNNQIVKNLIKKIQEKDLGFGVYLGQRQFIGQVDKFEQYSNIEYLEESTTLSTISNQDNFENCSFTDYGINIVKERMPIGFETVKELKTQTLLRKPCAPKNIFFEKSGKTIEGKFKNCYKLSQDNKKDEYVSFF